MEYFKKKAREAAGRASQPRYYRMQGNDSAAQLQTEAM